MSKIKHPSRRGLLVNGAAFAAALGTPIPFLRFLPEGMMPIALAETSDTSEEYAKDGLTVLGKRPINLETPAHLLDDKITPANRMFVRNNGQVPDLKGVTNENWFLEIDGEVNTPLKLSIADLKSQFEHVTLQLQMECGGNGRKFFSPGSSGNQWSFGAIACPQWTGVRLKDVLNKAGLKRNATYTGHYGADPHLSGDPSKHAISRGIPISKAMEDHTLICWSMNGENIPDLNGHPLRLLAPGWPGSCSQKWLTRIWVRDQIHDGSKMGGQSYRVPAYPVAPGTEVPDEDMEIIKSMPVKSLISLPETGMVREPRKSFEVRGHAWAGERNVKEMHTSIDFGQSWQKADLSAPANKYAWQHWTTKIKLPQAGYYEVWARATDDQGMMQPATPPAWNPRGYLNNMQHRVAIFAA